MFNCVVQKFIKDHSMIITGFKMRTSHWTKDEAFRYGFLQLM